MGRHLVGEMLATSPDCLYLLVRSEKAEREILRHLRAACRTDFNQRLRFLRGDITLPQLGLDAATLAGLSRRMDEVWHVAAATSFSERKRKEIEMVNLTGTRQLLDVVDQFDQLRRFYHISTAFVCGCTEGIIPEDWFPCPRSFRNLYEETKYRAEGLVRARNLPSVVIRPSVIMGDSRTGDAHGETRMVYGYLRALYTATLPALGSEQDFREYWRSRCTDKQVTKVNVRLRGDPSQSLNMVTIDDVITVCREIRAKSRSGQTFHIINPSSICLGFISQAIQRALRISGFRGDPSLTKPMLSVDNVSEKIAFRYTEPFWPYILSGGEPVWQADNVPALGVSRVVMTESLLEFLIQRYVENELIKHACQSN